MLIVSQVSDVDQRPLVYMNSRLLLYTHVSFVLVFLKDKIIFEIFFYCTILNNLNLINIKLSHDTTAAVYYLMFNHHRRLFHSGGLLTIYNNIVN